MSIHKTTLGAELTEEEYDGLQRAVMRAKLAINSIELDLEPHQMLQKATLIVETGFNLRDHVQRTMTAANLRKVEGRGAKEPLHLRVVGRPKIASDTQADIDAVLDTLLKGKPK